MYRIKFTGKQYVELCAVKLDGVRGKDFDFIDEKVFQIRGAYASRAIYKLNENFHFLSISDRDIHLREGFDDSAYTRCIPGTHYSIEFHFKHDFVCKIDENNILTISKHKAFYAEFYKDEERVILEDDDKIISV